ncbi:thioesterase family protein [Microbacterium sp. NPDC090225]|uniref:thioesterase family protein n=1 Tax=Microbacterium sp. NPDC090225 TaxID=3364207 RepID=UPI003826B6BB
MTAYFSRLSDREFEATGATQGAWNTAEQHIAPTIGLLAHLVEVDRDHRRDDSLAVARVSYDILGVLPIERVAVDVRVIRPGRTIELVEATLSHDGRVAVILRAWLMQRSSTSEIAGGALPVMPSLDAHAPWDAGSIWPGAFVRTADFRHREHEAGRASAWVLPRHVLLADEPISATARALGLVDLANGMTPRVPIDEAFFPNVDLTAHLFREPEEGWIGLDTTVTFGAGGVGLTHTVLNDASGPFGVSMQSLTVRAR